MKFFKTILIILSINLCFGLSAVDKPYKLLIVDSQDGEPYTSIREAMLKELNQLGYIVNENLVITYYSIGNEEGTAINILKAEEQNHNDVIFLNGTIAAKGFKNVAFGDFKYKFVFAGVTDPVGLSIIDNYVDRPKANFTGLCYLVKVEDRLDFVRKVMPEVKDIGFIYANMPQSHSYVKLIQRALRKEKYNDIKFHFREVEFVRSEQGHIRMSQLAKRFIKELDSVVDLYVSPSDQMGTQESFSQMVYINSEKPLLGLSGKDVMDNLGASFAIYPSTDDSGKRAARMIDKLFRGEDIRTIIPEWPESGIAFDLKRLVKWNVHPSQELLKEADGDVIK